MSFVLICSRLNFGGVSVFRSEDLKVNYATGKITYDDWPSCPQEKAHFLIICKFIDHIPEETDFHIENYQWVNCDGNNININSTVKDDNIFACELIYNVDRKQYDMKYKSVPTMIKNYKITPDFPNYKVEGYMDFIWQDCESEYKNYDLYCGLFDDIAKDSEVKIVEYKREITCGKTLLNFTSDNMKQHYITCLMYNPAIDKKIDKLSSGIPVIDKETWSLKLGKDLTKYEFRGESKFEWKTCELNDEYMDYRISCTFYHGDPTMDDFFVHPDIDMELECGGWPWQVMWSKNSTYSSWGCITYAKDAEKTMTDFKWILAPGIYFGNENKIEEKNGRWNVNGSVSFGFDECEVEHKQYGYVCDWFETVPTYDDMVNKKDQMKDIECYEKTILELTSNSFAEGYLGCGILRKSNNDILRIGYVTKRSIDIQEVALYKSDQMIFANGKIILNWDKCEEEKKDYKLSLKFLDHYPKYDEKWTGKEIDISCGKTVINEFDSNTNNIYFAVKLMKGDIVYDVETIKLPSFDISKLGFSFSQYYDHRIISGFVSIDFTNCERFHNQYSMICDFSNEIPTYESLMKGFKNKIVCDAWEIQGLTSRGTNDNVFGCMMIENESKKMVHLQYFELSGLDMNDIKIKHSDNDKITVNGILKYKLGSSSQAEDFHYLCKLSDTTPNQKDFKYEESQVINLDGNIVNLFEEKKHYFGCVLFQTYDKRAIDLQYLELPEFIVDNLHLEVNKKDNVWIPEGDIVYKWSSCGINQDKFELACEYSDSEPKSVNLDKAKKFKIICSGTNITSFTTDLSNDIFLGCSLVSKSDKEVYDFHFIKGHRHDDHDDGHSSSLIYIIVGASAGVVLLVAVALIVFFFLRSRKPKDTNQIPLIAPQ